jgi:hypothetical protein
LDTAPAGDDLNIGNRLIYSGPNLTCDTTAAGDDVQLVANGSSPAADPDGDGLDDRTTGTVQQQAGTLIHEFGHNLQLCHGGELDPPTFTQCNTNFKPNYLSLMNYTFQLSGIPPTDPDAGGPLTGRIDFSPADLADLNENNLNEPAGIGDGTDNTRYNCPTGAVNVGAGTGAIDWNCDGDGGVDASVAVDVNADGVFGTLAGHNDWANLKLDFQNSGDYEDGVHATTLNVVEIDVSIAVELSTPEAKCMDVTVPTDASVCEATNVFIDDGSFDPDGGDLTFLQSPAEPYPLGDTDVTLTVTDNALLFDSCMATVTVEDLEDPGPTCNAPASIIPPDAPISFTATANDNCGVDSVVITGYDCFMFTKEGKRIDKTGSCVVSINGDTITIEDSGGVGDNIEWTVVATDDSGNTTEATCSVAVVNPGRAE